jgi:cbb3-type cytochrome oxidase subunit 3
MTALLKEHFVIILLVLFAGVLFWAFRPKKRIKNQKPEDFS